MLIAWFVVSVIVAIFTVLGTIQDSIAFIKGIRRHPMWGLLVIMMDAIFMALVVLGILNLAHHYSYDRQEVRCSSIDGSVYDRKELKCYVNGEEK